jgi:hypothetical protein
VTVSCVPIAEISIKHAERLLHDHEAAARQAGKELLILREW